MRLLLLFLAMSAELALAQIDTYRLTIGPNTAGTSVGSVIWETPAGVAGANLDLVSAGVMRLGDGTPGHSNGELRLAVLTSSGNANVGGTLNVTGASFLAGANFSGAVLMTDALTVSGAGGLTVSGSAGIVTTGTAPITSGGNTNVGGTLNVTGSSFLAGANFSGAIVATSTLTVSGGAIFNGGFGTTGGTWGGGNGHLYNTGGMGATTGDFTGAVTMSNTLTVSGAGGLTVSGSAGIVTTGTAPITSGGNTNVGGTLNVTGSSFLAGANFSGAIVATSTLTVSGGAVFNGGFGTTGGTWGGGNGHLYNTGGMDATTGDFTGAVTMSNTLTVSGAGGLTVSGSAGIVTTGTAPITSGGNTNVGGTLNVTGSSFLAGANFSSAVLMTNALTVSGAGGLTVSGSAGIVTTGTAPITSGGNTNVGGTLNVTGASFLAAANFSGSILATGTVVLSGLTAGSSGLDLVCHDPTTHQIYKNGCTPATAIVGDIRTYGAVCGGLNQHTAVVAALTAGETRLWFPAGCTWVVPHAAWTYGSTTVPGDSIPGGLEITGESWTTSQIQSAIPSSYQLYVGPQTILRNLSVAHWGCQIWNENTQTYDNGATPCPGRFYLNAGFRYSGTVNVSGTTVTYVSGAKFITDSTGASSWVYNGYTNPFPQININGTLYTVSAVASQTSLTLSTSAGFASGVPYYFDQYRPPNSNGYQFISMATGGPGDYAGIQCGGFGRGDCIYAGVSDPGGTAFRGSADGGGSHIFLAQRLNNAGDGFSILDDNTNAYAGVGYYYLARSRTSGNLLEFQQQALPFSGNAMVLNMAMGSGSFSGKFFAALNNSVMKFYVDYDGTIAPTRLIGEATTQTANDSIYLGNTASPNFFLDRDTAGTMIFGYNTPRTVSGGDILSVYNNLTDRTALLKVTSRGSSGGADAITMNAPLTVSASGGIVTSGSGPITAGGNVNVGGTLNVTGSSFLAGANFSGGVLMTSNLSVSGAVTGMRLLGQTTTQTANDTIYLGNTAATNVFMDRDTAGQVILGYNTPRTVSGGDIWTFYNNLTDRTALLKLTSRGSFGGSDAITMNAPLTVSGSGGIVTSGSGPITAGGNVNVGGTLNVTGSSFLAGANFSGGVLFTGNVLWGGGFGQLSTSGDLSAVQVTANSLKTGVLNTFASSALSIGTNSTTRIYVDATGNVGIAQTSPSYLLDVNGTARLSGGLITGNILSFGTVTATGYTYNSSPGLSSTVTVRNSAGTGTCTLTFTLGGYTGGTC